MSTRSYIVRKADRGYEGAYCHWDGYPEHNGAILLEHYSHPEKLAKLISLGDMSLLGPNIGKKHSFDDRPDGVTTYYGRDRGESGVEPRHYQTLKELLSSLVESGCEYVYVYDAFWQYASRGPQYFGGSDGSPFSKLRPLWTAFTTTEKP